MLNIMNVNDNRSIYQEINIHHKYCGSKTYVYISEPMLKVYLKGISYLYKGYGLLTNYAISLICS